VPPAHRIEVTAYQWPEVAAGDDLAALVAGACELANGDIVVVTSKVVSKAEGRVVTGDRDELIAAETARVVARRGRTVIAETTHGLVLAAAGVDASNVAAGAVVLLPRDPDDSARRLRDDLLARTGANVAVVITDTAGRAWRIGQTDIAIGCAGLAVVVDYAGHTDPHGNVLSVTAPAVADELAGAGDLVKQKTSGRPLAVVRGLAERVCAPGEHGRGAVTLQRPAALDMFGLGVREAAVAAVLRSDPEALGYFAPPVDSDPSPFAGVAVPDPQVRMTLEAAGGSTGRPGWDVLVEVEVGASSEVWVRAGRLLERLDILGTAHGLSQRRLSQRSTAVAARPGEGWQTLSGSHWFVA